MDGRGGATVPPGVGPKREKNLVWATTVRTLHYSASSAHARWAMNFLDCMVCSTAHHCPTIILPTYLVHPSIPMPPRPNLTKAGTVLGSTLHGWIARSGYTRVNGMEWNNWEEAPEIYRDGNGAFPVDLNRSC
jgi:hypothetical protein